MNDSTHETWSKTTFRWLIIGIGGLAWMGCGGDGSVTATTASSSGGPSSSSSGTGMGGAGGQETGGAGGAGGNGANDARMIFALDDGVTNDLVDGLAIRIGWAKMEPTEGTYDWTQLDSRLDSVAAAKKKVTLHLIAAVLGPSTPPWLEPAGAQFYSTGKANVPVPWDPVYLAKWSAFLPRVAEHLTSAGYMPIVANVSVGVPIPEMNLFTCNPQTQMLTDTIPYEREKYLTAWKQMIDLYGQSFPDQNKFVSAPQNGICGKDNDTAFYRSLMDHALAKDAQRYWMFGADLRASGSPRVEPYVDIGASIGFQPVAAVTNDPNGWVKGTAKEMYCSALKLGASYVEIYAGDLTSADPAVQAGIAVLHDPSLCP